MHTYYLRQTTLKKSIIKVFFLLLHRTYKVDLENRKKDKEAKRQEEELEKIAELKLDDVAPIGRDASQTSQEPFVRGERVDLGGEDGEQENGDGIDSDSIDEADY